MNSRLPSNSHKSIPSLARLALRTNARCPLEGGHGLDAKLASKCFSDLRLVSLHQRLVLFAMAGASTAKSHIQTL
jgi:hypothetical protein